MDPSLYLVAGLLSFGYLLNKDGKVKREKIRAIEPLSEQQKPNSYNPVKQTRLKKVQNIVQKEADKVWNNSMNSTNVIPANFNRDHEVFSQEQTLTGEPFVHNNMVPFFGSNIKQNVNVEQNNSTLELFTGGASLKPPKHEVENMFKPEKNVGNPCGMVEGRDTDRYVPSLTQDGIKPFQPIRVGRGLNQGPTSKPSGGFHDSYRVQEKTVDELNIKKKETYDGRINPPKTIVQNRGNSGKLEKNRPEKYQEQTPDHLFKTTGAYTKETNRSKVVMKATNRKKVKSYTGIAGPSTEEHVASRPKVQKDRNTTLCATGNRNLAVRDGWKAKKGDYNKDSFQNYPNERQVTGCRSHRMNLKTDVGKQTVPLDDKAKSTRKQHYVTYSRRGNVLVPGIKQHIAPILDKIKTTIKETLIHDTRSGAMAPQRPNKRQAFNEANKARRTHRESTEDNLVRNNLKSMGTNSHKMYKYLDKPKTTIKETLVHDTRTGNVGVSKKKTSIFDKIKWRFKTTHREVRPNAKWGCCPGSKPSLTGNKKPLVWDQESNRARRTMKQTTIDAKQSANLAGMSKQIAYDPEDIAKRTMKETTIDKKRIGNVSDAGLQQGKGYMTTNATAPNTNRQYTSDIEYFGVADADVNGGGDGYKTNPHEAPNTNRQFTSDVEYVGTAESNSKSQMSYKDMYNAELNALKEKVAKGRKPTNSSTKIAIGGDEYNIEARKKVSQEEQTHELNADRVYSNTPDSNICQITKVSNKNDGDDISERINPEILDTFKANPYTQSLNSI